MKNRVFFSLLTFIAFSFFLSIPLYAQLAQTDVSLEAIPDVPGPYQTVTLNLVSYAVDLNHLSITWYENGVLKLSGFGKKQFSFETKGLGVQTSVEARIVYGTSTLVKTFIIIPSDVDLLWEAADSYVPPFYRGKALIPSQGLVKIIALPEFEATGGLQNSSGSVYTWKRNYNTVQEASGYGKNVFTFRHNYLNPAEYITVTATNATTNRVAKRSITLGTQSPKIIFYEKDPLEGIKYADALTEGLTVGTSEKTFIAEPYFFSPGTVAASELTYTWKINGAPVVPSQIKNQIVLKSGSAGSSEISLDIKNVKYLFQTLGIRLPVNLTD